MADGTETGGQQPTESPLADDDGNISSPKRTLETAAAEAEIWTVAEMESAEPITIDIDEELLRRRVESMLDGPDSPEAAEGAGRGSRRC